MLTDAMKRQFDKAFDVLEAATGAFRPEQWRRGSPPFDGPGRAAAHALKCAEGYTGKETGFWKQFGKDIWEMADQELPSQEQMLQYLAQARSLTAEWIDAICVPAAGASWDDDESDQRLEPVVYALRHLQHHTGELCAYQKQCGLEPAPWK